MATGGKAGLSTYSPFAKKQRPGPILGADGLRSDGRDASDFRPAFMKTGTISRAAGSAYVEFGSTKVLVAVYGPRESRKAEAFSDLGRLNCHVSVASFATAVRGRAPQGGDEKEYSTMLQRALVTAVNLSSFPKTTVDVFGLIVSSGGSDLAVLITAGSLALADSGIEMFDLVAAASIAQVGRQLLVDPTLDEERAAGGSILLASMAQRDEITQMTMTGEWKHSVAAEAMELCTDGCASLDELMRTALKEHAAATMAASLSA